MHEEHGLSPEPDISVFRPDRPGIRKVLGDLEAEIMELVWARPPGQPTTVRDVFEVLHERRRLAYTTVMSTMARLARKKLLHVEKVEQAYAYHPTLSRDEFVAGVVARMLENLLVGFAGPTLEGIEKLSDLQAAARARRLLDEIARRRATEEAE